MSIERFFILAEHFPELVSRMALKEGVSIGELRRMIGARECHVDEAGELVRCQLTTAINKLKLEVNRLMESSK
jgi:hypothetical protein